MEFPDIYNSDFKKDDYKLAKQAIDFAVQQYESQTALRVELAKLYDSYNGIVNQKDNESITKPFGKRLKTPYTHWNFGLNKVKTLVGEFLSSPMDPIVETIDDDQVNKKYEKFLERKAMLDLKPQIQTAQQSGYNIYPGMVEQMDDEQEFLAPKNFKTDNEVILTKYLKKKIISDRLKLKFKSNIIDGICSCLLCSKIETVNGVDTVRHISPLKAMFMEYETEGFFEDSPYVGEKRYLFKHQIIKELGITDPKDLKTLDDWKASPQNMLQDKSYQYKNGELMYPVYTIEFKTIANITYIKIDKTTSEIPYIREIQEKEYLLLEKTKQKNPNLQIDIVKLFIEEVWEITRVGMNMYKNIKRTVRQANTIENRKLRARYNYVLFGMDNVEGIRVPIQSIIAKLDKSYNDVQFLLAKEIKKPTGSALGINMGYLDKNAGSFKDVMTELSEEGTIRFNTASEGNKFNLEGKSEQALSGVNVGDKGRVVEVLLRLKTDIENSIDRITGITRGRTGNEFATTTATTSNNNLESSRTVTYDFFYQAKTFFDEVLTRLVEKGKLNMIENNPDLFGGIFSDEEFNFIKATSDIPLENFSAAINDGRKEMQIMEKIEGLFQGDINSQQLRSKDVARFYLADSLHEGLKVLDKAWAEITQVQQSQQQQQSQAQAQAEQAKTQADQQALQANQQHDLDMIDRQGEVDQENIRLKGDIDGNTHSDNNATKNEIADKKANADIVKSRLALQSKENQQAKTVKNKTKK